MKLQKNYTELKTLQYDCDETIATDPEELVGFLTEKGHPALSMEPMM